MASKRATALISWLRVLSFMICRRRSLVGVQTDSAKLSARATG